MGTGNCEEVDRQVRKQTGELVHRAVSGLFPGADKARSASGRLQSRMRSIWDVGAECEAPRMRSNRDVVLSNYKKYTVYQH